MSLKVINVQSDKGTALVQGKHKTFPVQLAYWLRFLVRKGDLCKVTKSQVTGEWVMTDYIKMG